MSGLNLLKLDLGNSHNITFRPEWVRTLRTLPIGDYGAFLRDTIYPSLIAPDRKVWQRSRISNMELQTAVMEFKPTPVGDIDARPRGRPRTVQD